MAATSFSYLTLGYVALGVSNVSRSVAFYRDVIGLDLSEIGADGAAYLRCSNDHHDIVLYPADAPIFLRVGWQLASDGDLDIAFDHVAALGLSPKWVGDGKGPIGQGGCFRCHLPVIGTDFEFFADMATMPTPFPALLTQIERLGHVVLGVPHRVAAEQYMVDNLGFRLSDTIDDTISFLRAHPNPLHHTLAFAKKEDGPILNHVNFMVRDMDDIGRALNRLRKLDVPIVFGPGRHPTSESIFLYFLDPDGFTLEYSFGMEEFAIDDPRAPRLFERKPESFDLWGSIRDPRMGATGRVVTGH